MMPFFKKNTIYAIIFIVPALLLLIVYALRGVYPFGQNSVLALDLNGQYIYYYEAYRNAFLGGGSLLYSFSRTLGGEMVGIFAYYLASPFNFILLAFPQHFITEAVLCIILLKTGAAAVSFSIYLKKSKNASDMECVIFSVMYSLMSYFIIQAMNPMWLDGLILFPLIILGTERLIKSGNSLLLTITLSLLFICNFYIGYMTGIFTFIYFLYYLFGRHIKKSIKEWVILGLQFFRTAILSAGLAMFILLPVFFSLSLGKFGFSTPDLSLVQKVDIFDIFTKLLPVSYDSVNYPGYPFIFAGTMTTLLLCLYFLSNKIPLKEKLASGLLIAAMIGAFSIYPIDIALHGFQHPVWLNHRYSFIFSFMILVLAYEAYSKIAQDDNKMIAKCCLGLMLAVAIIGKIGYPHIRPEVSVWLSFLLLVLYSSLIFMSKAVKLPFITVIIAVLISIEMMANAFVMIEGAHKEVHFSDRPSYRDYFERMYPAVEYIKETDQSFHRVETVIRRTVNDPFALDIYGVSHSSSLFHNDVLNFMYKLGFASREHWTRYKGATILTDSILGIKYMISENAVNRSYESVYEANQLHVFKNPYALSVAYPVSEAFLNLDMVSIDPFVNQNSLLSSMLGQEYTEYFKLMPIKNIIFENMSASQEDGFVEYRPIDVNYNAHIEYILEPVGDNENYMYLHSPYPRKVNIWLNREYVDTFFSYESICIIPLNVPTGSDSLSLITTPIEGEYYLSNNMFYYLDRKLFDEDIKKIRQTESIELINQARIRIKLKSDGGEVLFTSIPYDKGWKAKVNGERTETEKAAGALIAVKLNEGEQIVDLSYTPRGMTAGVLISILSLLTLIYITVKEKRKRGMAKT